MVRKLVLSFLLLMVSGSRGGSASANKGYTTPYHHNSTKCRDQEREYYKRALKICCSRCPPGQKVQRSCSEREDTACAQCPAGQHTEHWNSLPKCIACARECNLEMEEVLACTASTRRVCSCREDFHCIDGDNSTTCNMCQRNIPCSIGQGGTHPATPWRNTECKPCQPGTYSSTISTEPCRNHTRCETLRRRVVSPGTSTKNTVCSDEFLTSLPTSTATIPVLINNTMEMPSERAPTTSTSQESPAPVSGLLPPWALILMVAGIVLPVALLLFMKCHLAQKKRGRMTVQHSQPPVKDDSCEKLITVTDLELQCVQLDGAVKGALVTERQSADTSHGDTCGNSQQDQGSAARESQLSSVKPSPSSSITLNGDPCYVNCIRAPLDPTPSSAPNSGSWGQGVVEEFSKPETHFPIQETL
uniref:Tumor necrosis factor receptor superfamily member 1B-like protein n=1 Tax=Callorhinchus milii TaxID=7868 RepID=V9KTZ8_CALMI|eukprot:gi/632960183/ref/XP_007896049.1/ PREDICTED: tumor necrosis factor receptor superfamily member 1B-like [Callorhinchus milii]